MPFTMSISRENCFWLECRSGISPSKVTLQHQPCTGMVFNGGTAPELDWASNSAAYQCDQYALVQGTPCPGWDWHGRRLGIGDRGARQSNTEPLLCPEHRSAWDG